LVHLNAPQKNSFADKTLQCLQSAVQLAKEMGHGLERSEGLQRAMPQTEE
jgi:hypothetical protein